MKELARQLGYKENEFGELQATTTKAEARRRFLLREHNARFLIDALVKQAHDDICALEDARVFAILDESASVHKHEQANL